VPFTDGGVECATRADYNAIARIYGGLLSDENVLGLRLGNLDFGL